MFVWLEGLGIRWKTYFVFSGFLLSMRLISLSLLPSYWLLLFVIITYNAEPCIVHDGDKGLSEFQCVEQQRRAPAVRGIRYKVKGKR